MYVFPCVILFLCFFSPFSIAVTSLGEERASLSAFRTFVRFVLVWICRFPVLLGVWEGLRFVIVALPGLFSYLFFYIRTRNSQTYARTYRHAHTHIHTQSVFPFLSLIDNLMIFRNCCKFILFRLHNHCYKVGGKFRWN